MEQQLVLISGRRRGASFTLTGVGIVLGRDPDADVVIPDPTVSRKHCRVYLQGEKILIEDLKSRNLPLLNGIPVSNGELRLGDEIAIGAWRFLVTSAFPAEAESGKVAIGVETWSWSKAQTVELDVDSTTPLTDNRPRTVQDLAFLHEVTRGLSEADTLPGVVSVLHRRLEERFKPTETWIARVHGQDSLSFFQPDEQVPDKAVLSVIEKGLQERRGLLAPGTARRDGRKVLMSTLVAPVRLAEMNVAVIAIQTEAPKGAYEEEDLRLLVLLAQSMAPFISALENLDQLRHDYERLRARTGESLTLVGHSRVIGQVRASIARAANSDLSVLITGESATGKELAAHLLHVESLRHSGPFVVVNCAAIPPGLFESEFFGHVKGAFTGAAEEKEGLFAMAHGGTLFLDEISNLSTENQARILRAVELSVFRRIGDPQETQVNVRIVAASNIDIRAAVANGSFREDLYHRLNGFEIAMPPLRERPSDIPMLAQYFLDLAKGHSSKRISGISKEAIEFLAAQRWPGNVRELRHTLLRAIHMAHGPEIQVKDLTQGTAVAPASERPDSPLLSLQEVEKRYIAQVMQDCSGDLQAAAAILDIGRSTLYRKIAEYGIKA